MIDSDWYQNVLNSVLASLRSFTYIYGKLYVILEYATKKMSLFQDTGYRDHFS